MFPTFFRGLFQLIRFFLNFGAPKKELRNNVDEIYRQLEVLQLDFSNAKEVSAACVYLADPHKLPRPAKDTNNNGSKSESNVNSDISLHDFHCEKSDERDQLSEQYQIDDMSISSVSDFEETLQNHFQYIPRSAAGDHVENHDSSIDFASLVQQQQNMSNTKSVSVAFTTSFKSNTSFPQEGNFSPQDFVENVNISNGKDPYSKRRKRQLINNYFDRKNRRITNHQFDESSPVEQFCSNSLVTSTPVSTKSHSEGRRRLTMARSAIRSKVRELKQLTRTNLSGDGVDSMNASSLKNEAMMREQGAIVKHIARIRTSNSKLGLSKEAVPSFNDTHYYSMNTLFGSSGSTSFS